MKHNVGILSIVITVFLLLIIWMRCAYINTYRLHTVTPIVIDKWHYPVKHRYKSRRWIDTTYQMCVKSPNYGYAHLYVDDITYYNHIKKDTLLFHWTNHDLAVFDSKYDKGLLLNFTFVTLLSVMIICILYFVFGPILLCQNAD